MRFVDIIEKKKNKEELTKEEIKFAIESFTNEEIPDYQMSALLMAIVLNGMTDEETYHLTEVMLNSGDVLDLSGVEWVVVDKHSTGGIGDKTTLILGPILASLGCKVAKMSGRGLGITGGTADKLEAIEGYDIKMTIEEFIKQIKEKNIALAYSIGNLAPADKKIYALRDVTATVESIPLIASSIMSKKLASGADCLILDVKVGSGAFMKDIESARKLAKTMVKIGKHFNKKVRAILTNMDIPLGRNIGNLLEVQEVVQVLNNNGPEDLKKVTVTLASNLLNMAIGKSIEECEYLVNETLDNGRALEKFKELIESQNGKYNSIFRENQSKVEIVKATDEGYITKLVAENIGRSSMMLKAGRQTKEDKIDYEAGIILLKKINDYVKKGDELAYFYYNDDELLKEAEKVFLAGVEYSKDKVDEPTLIYEVIE
ncbi:MAG: thymidine phosphorylase [Bacilli bacterium]|nr:thymidine phosphorylase [Bacilli bacterium]